MTIHILRRHILYPPPHSYLSIFFRSMHSLQISNNHPPYKRLKSYINCLLATMWPNLLRTRTWITIFKYFFLISILLSSAFLRRQQEFAQIFVAFSEKLNFNRDAKKETFANEREKLTKQIINLKKVFLLRRQNQYEDFQDDVLVFNYNCCHVFCNLPGRKQLSWF